MTTHTTAASRTAMAKLATCPGCTTQLALPEDATLSDRARCPRCFEEFLLMETVQFSIPTAEILAPAEPKTFTPSDTLSPGSYVPNPDPYAPESADLSDSSSPGDFYNNTDPEKQDTKESELTSEPLPANATLSDWEARLKRAIAGDVDKPSLAESASTPIFELNEPALQPPRSAEPVTYEPHDFEVPDTDLIPESAPPVTRDEHWTSESSDEIGDDVTVKVAGDQTVSEFPSAPQIDELPQAIRTEAASKNKKRKRSPLRTLASASLGVVGIPLGLYALLWLRGPDGDMLHIARYLPSFMLPAEFREPSYRVANEQLVQQPTEENTSDPEETLAVANTQADEAAEVEPLIREDSEVAQASAELPAYQGPTFEPVDSAEFGELLAAAQQAAPQLSVGDLSTKESVASKGQAYMALARLADKGSFLHQSDRTSDDIVLSNRTGELLQTTLRDQVVQRDLPQISLRWWQYADRPSQGIVLIGRIQRIEETAAGKVMFVSLMDDGVTPEVPILVSDTDYSLNELIGVAGSIESAPAERLPALDASWGPVVLGHYSFSLADNVLGRD